MIKLIFLIVAVLASIYIAQGSCSCGSCSSCQSGSGGILPATCVSTGCTAQFYLTDLTAIDAYTGHICATNKCFVGGSCPSYSRSGSDFASSPMADKYIGAFAAKIATANLDDICWYNQTLTCPPGSCPVDTRLIGEVFSVWCVTTTPCPPGFNVSSSYLPYFNYTQTEYDQILGAVAQYTGVADFNSTCAQFLDIGSM